MEDERCCCFVLCTRAKDRVYLSGVRQYRKAVMGPSRFVREMGLVGGKQSDEDLYSTQAGARQGEQWAIDVNSPDAVANRIEMTEAEAIAHDVQAMLRRGGRIVVHGRNSTVIEMPEDDEDDLDDPLD